MKYRYGKAIRLIARIMALVLIFSFILVSCEEEPKRNFPDNGGDVAVGNSPNKKPSGNSNSGNKNNNSNNNSNNNNSNSGKKRVAITYDDGPHNVYTVKIVDELAKYGFNATFFVVGNRVDGTDYNGAKGITYAASKGNEIAIHAYTHSKYYNKCLDKEYEEELSKTYDAIKAKVPNAKVKLMRPVGGAITKERIESCDYSVILWDVDSLDWDLKHDGEAGVKQIVNNVMSTVKNGSIILMHDLYENTYLATQQILKQLDEQGYDVVTVSELLGSPKAGVKYSRAQ